MKNAVFTFDKIAISLSALCAVHCLLLPLLIVMLPALTSTILGEESFHKWLLVLVIPTSIAALVLGCRKHRNNSVLRYGIPGLVVITLAAFFGNDLAGETGEKIATLAGALLISIGHFLNYRLCRKSDCCT